MHRGYTSFETCWGSSYGVRVMWANVPFGATFPTNWLVEAGLRRGVIYRRAKLRNSLERNARELARNGFGCRGGAVGLLRYGDDCGAALFWKGPPTYAADLRSAGQFVETSQRRGFCFV